MPFTTLISAKSLAKNLDNENWAIFDCRFSLDDLEKGRIAHGQEHIAGARYVHLNDDLSGPIEPGVTGRHPLPDQDAFVEQLGQWGLDAHTQVVAYDDSNGAIAARLWWMLRWVGHDEVAVLDGGWPTWKKLGLPTQNRSESREARRYVQRRPLTNQVDVKQVTTLSAKRDWALVDARAPERYRGEHEPIDPVAGRIPGALNHPFTKNVNSDGLFLEPGTLRSQFEAVLGTDPTEQTIFYCGSGVTAAHNVLAFAHAGLGDAHLYPGSWSEWITDLSNPIATG